MESLLLVVALVTAVQVVVTMSALVPSAIAPELAGSLAVPTELIGYQIAAVYGAAMLTSLIGGTLVRRSGACRISQLALVLCGAGALLAMVPSLAALAVASLLIGFGYGLTNPPSSHLLAKHARPGNRNLLFSIKQTGVPLGGIAAGLIAPAVTVAAGWSWAFATTAAAALALAFALQPLRATWDADRDPSLVLEGAPWRDVRLVWQTAALRRLSLAAFCFAAIQLCLVSFTVALLVEDLAFGLIQAGAVLSIVQAAGFIGRVFWGWLADRLGNGLGVLLSVTALSAASALSTGLLFVAGPWAAYLVLPVFGFAAIGWNGLYLAEVARLSPRGMIGSSTGGSLVFTFAGVLAGPPAFALAYRMTGAFTATVPLLAMLAVLGFALVLAARRDACRR